MGEFNTGKSTFINAILGKDLLPAKYVPTTRQVMRIAHSEGPAQVAVADPAHASPSLPLSRDAILKLAGTGERLDIQTRIPAPWSDLVLYDTPGVNDATAIAEDLIFDLMDQVDVVVFMMRADAALKESEARFLGQLVRHKDLDKFFFNVNFADLLDPGEGERVRTRVTDTLGRLRNWPSRLLRDRVFLCSARQSLARGPADPASRGVDPTNDHDGLLWALHAYATTRKQDLLRAYAENLIRTVAQAAGEKLTAAIEAAGGRDAGYGKALVQINSEINGLRASIREEEIAFQSHVRDRKRVLITKVGEALNEIRLDFHDRIMAASEGEIHDGDWLQRGLRVEVEGRLAALLAQFRADVEGAFTDLDHRILPAVNRAIGRIEGIQRGFDFATPVAGAGVAAAGYAVVTTALPWIVGAGGIVAVTAGLASFIPGVGVAIGALLGAGLKAGISGAIGIFSKTATTAQEGYSWLRDTIRQWEQGQDKARYCAQLDLVIDKMKRDLIERLDSAIDPMRITDGVIAARFPQGRALEDRRLLATKLDRTRLRETLGELEDLRSRLVQLAPRPGGHHE